ncbi:Unannotated [Lentimonas sp. CC4]|nr:Unannotated [Lentimonas sp. CC4]CAA6685659.1 Unannotated [Lentimonas sp. CC6]CAA7077103.1 Unannotated [Lentimonas sp. CC4]CAA7180820.1 Unannotated [Lentimonas sp. CC8]
MMRVSNNAIAYFYTFYFSGIIRIQTTEFQPQKGTKKHEKLNSRNFVYFGLRPSVDYRCARKCLFVAMK